MPAPAKFITFSAVEAKVEGSYGAGGSLSAATDGVQTDELPKLAVSYANDGARPAPPGTLGYQRKVVPTGKVGDLPIKHAAKLPGVGVPYSSSVFFSAHNLLRGCGFDAAGSFVGGSEKWTYTPTPGPSGYASLVMALYARGELWPFTGVLGDFTWGFKGPEVPTFDFAFKGLLGTYTDVSVPVVTYPYDARDAIKATSAACTLFGVSQATLREATLKLGRTLVPRLDVIASGHLGFTPTRRTPTLELLVETPLIATQDFFSAYETGSNSAWSLNLTAGGQYNRMKWSGAGAQIMSPPKLEDDGAVALTRLSLQLNPSTLTANDDLQLVTD